MNKYEIDPLIKEKAQKLNEFILTSDVIVPIGMYLERGFVWQKYELVRMRLSSRR